MARWGDAAVGSRGRHPRRRLTDVEVRSAGPGRHSDGEGLHLFVRPNGARSWVQRIVVQGRRRDMGLGGYPLVSLAKAREAALVNRSVARAGGVPKSLCPSAQRVAVPTVREVTADVIASRRPTWRNASTEKTWHRLFNRYVFPRIGDMPVNEVTLRDMEDIVLPLWKGRGSEGAVLRQYLDIVMRRAMTHAYRSDNPAALVKEIAPKTRVERQHRPSLPHPKVCEAMEAVKVAPCDIAVRSALLFTVLCASRIGEVLGAQWSEFDYDGCVWTLSPERMKAGRLHRVPLTRQALDILDCMRALSRHENEVFVLRKHGGGMRPVSSHDLWKTLRSLGYVDESQRPIVMHGFRATFRMWAMEVERAPSEICEAALAHRQDETQAAYARPSFDLRSELMQTWADYVAPQSSC